MSHAACRVLLLSLFGLCLLVPAGDVRPMSVDHGFFGVVAPKGEEEGEGQKHEALYKWINFLLLAVGLTFILRKPLAQFFAGRSASIRKSLDEGRKALEASQAQLQAVEEKLRHLEEEIAAFKASAGRETEAERERLRQAAAEEAEKILASARAQMETAAQAAKLDLRIYASQQAVELAEEMIRQRLDDASRRRLISQFMAKLKAKETKN